MINQYKVKLLLPAIGIGIIILFLFLLQYHGHKAKGEKQNPGGRSYSTATTSYGTATFSGSEAHIPFTLRNSHIYIEAVVGHKHVLAMVDTGTDGVVWPKSLQLGGLPQVLYTGGSWHRELTRVTGPDGRWILGEMVELPEIQAGDFTLLNSSTVCLDHYFSSADGNILILGSTAFAHGVLIIDYRHKMLLLQSKEAASQQRHYHNKLPQMHFDWIGTNSLSPGHPTVIADVEGHPVRLIFDTGSSDLVLTSAFCNRYLSHRKFGNAIFSSSLSKTYRTRSISNISLNINGVTLRNQKAAVLPDNNPKALGVIGNIFPQKYRITIDYPHQTISFDPTL